ncbi:MAG: hypothetical protein M3Y57_23235 [Acidobacteriota bacterium]|nr:hypothetical protein [Acidobacteriota bacterium]
MKGGSATTPRAKTSFRDPAGSVLLLGRSVFRRISADHAPAFEQFLNSATGRSLIDSGQLIGTRSISNDDFVQDARYGPLSELIGEGDSLVEHDRVWFPSYAYEWPTAMLHAAGKLTIELAQAALDESFGLKDATPYNILFRSSKPVFVDVLSFERRDPGNPTWLPYAQFLRMFILPLLMSQHFGVTGAEVFLSHADGYQPDEVYRRFHWMRRLRAPLLTTVSIPTGLSRRTDPSGKARFVLDTQFRRLTKLLDRLKPPENGDSA